MEKFKQAIANLEKEMAALKAELASIKGSQPIAGNTHYVASGQEFGEYSLEELDTFRFKMVVCGGPANTFQYSYTLTNPTPELSAYLRLQNKTFATQYIPVEPDAFESHCMKGDTPFVLTAEIRKCLESKLWEFAGSVTPHAGAAEIAERLAKVNPINNIFSTTITIPLTQTYKIVPHVSYYITPLPLQGRSLDISCEIKEITTKQVIFKISYGNSYPYKETDLLKLHYGISGILATEEQDLI
jgi:hypothetical protein